MYCRVDFLSYIYIFFRSVREAYGNVVDKSLIFKTHGTAFVEGRVIGEGTSAWVFHISLVRCINTHIDTYISDIVG